MNLSILIFVAGMVLLGLFVWYFGTDLDRRKKVIGAVLTVFVTAFAAFGMFYTGHLPDEYTLLLQPTGPEAGQDLDDALRAKAADILERELSEDTPGADEEEDEDDAGEGETGPLRDRSRAELAIATSLNTVTLSRQNLSLAEVEAAAEKLEEEAGLAAQITHEPKPLTNIKKGIDLQGGSSFVVQIGKGEDGPAVSESLKQEAIAVFEQRLNEGGTKDLLITTQGEERIMIQMPGVKPEEIEGIRTKIQQVAKLEFRLVKEDSQSILASLENPEDPVLIPGWEKLPYRESDDDDRRGTRYEVVKNRADITGEAVASAAAVYGLNGWEIALSSTSEGGQTFYDVTAPNVNQRLAIILDGEILSAPNINDALRDNISIFGDFTLEEAVGLASALENPLEVQPQIVDERSVSATYGGNTIKQGLYAGIVGLSITLVFVVIYYKVAGLVALFGLLVNLFILLGTMAMFGFTLTMPGIAGIVLTIGIAVDANVIIFERLREELKEGKSLGHAMKAAYDKAFSAIFDANITTLITATILFIIASGTVKGFAITLTIGILASLFAALLVTRVCFMWMVAPAGPMTNLRLWDIIPDKVYDLLGKRRMAAMLSLALLVAAIATYAVKQEDTLGVDFRGGELLTLQATEQVTKASVTDALADLPIEKFVQTEASPSGNDFITIRTAFLEPGRDTGGAEVVSNARRIQAELQNDLGVTLDNLEIESVGPVVGRELARSSLLAMVLGVVGILVYLAFRFEFSFAIAAIVALVHDIAISLGIIAMLGGQLQLIHVGAMLTIAGYSINDTIIIFDRVREELRSKRGEVKAIMNLAISQTLSRTLLTSVTTLVVVTTLAIFGGPSLRDFSVTIIIGIIIGTYSSIYVACPVVLWWTRRTGKNLRREILDADQTRIIDTSGIEREAGPGR